MQNQKYHLTTRVLHWLMALIILGMVGVGFYMTGLEKNNPLRSDLTNLHKSFGVLVLLLLTLRIAARLKFKAPRLPKTLKKPEAILAKSVQILLYGFMLVIPISGYLMSNGFGYGVKFFGVSLPKIIAKNIEFGKLMHELHEILPYVMLAIIALHLLGALKHRFFDKPENDVLGRMV